jgi:trigger factor
VPRKLLEQRFGRNVKTEVAAELINNRFREAAAELEFIGQPDVEKGDLLDQRDFRFAVTVQVKPAVEVSGYAGLKVVFPQVQVTDAQVDAQVGRRLAGHARLVEVTDDRPVEAGDLVLTELREGEAVLEAGTMISTEAERQYPGVEMELLGLRRGESKDASLSFGEDAQAASVRGRTVALRLTVLGIQVQQVPDLDDALAGSLGFEGGAAAMRAAIRMELETRAGDVARTQARINLLRTLVDAHPVGVPPALVEKNLRLLMEEVMVQQSYRGRDPRSVRFSDAQLADLRTRAEFASRGGLLLEAIARREGLEVTDADLDAKYQEIADSRGQRVEAIKGYIAKDGAEAELRRHILEERTLDWLLERSDLVAPATPDADAAVATPAEVAPPAPVAEEAVPPEGSKPKRSRKKKVDTE